MFNATEPELFILDLGRCMDSELFNWLLVGYVQRINNCAVCVCVCVLQCTISVALPLHYEPGNQSQFFHG